VIGLENSAQSNIGGRGTPYNYRGAKLHFVDLMDARATHARCFRCHRDLPIEQFQPIFGVSRSLKSIRPSIRRQTALHPHCWKCREQEKGEWTAHPKYSPALDRFWSMAMSRLIAGARARGLLVAVEKDDLLGLYLKQNGCCALTGLPMDFRAKGGSGRSKRAMTAPSVDRIDSHGNYTLDNIHIVMSAVNVMKNDMSTDQFVALCEQVAAHRLAGG
jgi:hypothetical protein